MVFTCKRFEDAGTLDLVVALAVVGFILVFGIVSRWLFPCPTCKAPQDAFTASSHNADATHDWDNIAPEGFLGARS